MEDRIRFRLLACVMLVGACGLISCAQGPAPLRPGTPAFHWAAAGTAWQAGDFLKTNDNLNQLVTSESEFAPRARAWQLIAASGLAEGYTDLADAYESGSRYNRTDAMAFREQVRMARSAASRLSLQAAETFRRFLDVDKSTTVPSAFASIPIEMPVPAFLAKLNKGILLKGAEAEGVERAIMRHAMLQAAARAAGVKAEAIRAEASFPKEIPREQFLLGTAASLTEQSALFGRKKLDQPQQLLALCGLAQEALRQVPPGSKVKELEDKIQAAMGKRRAS